MKKVFKIILIILVVLLTFLTILFFIPDDELSETSKKWLIVPTDNDPANNMFNGFYAFNTAEVKDFIQQGIEEVKQTNKEISDFRSEHGGGGDNLELFNKDKTINDSLLTTTFTRDDLCYVKETNCVDFWKEKQSALETLINENKTLVSRKKQLSQLSTFTTTLSSDILSPVPDLRAYQDISTLVVNASAANYIAKDDKNHLAFIERELNFNRLLLEETDSLIFKMLANKYMTQAVTTLSQLLDNTKNIEHFTPIKQLTDLEFQFEKPFQSEFQLVSNITKFIDGYTASPEPREISPKLVKFLLKPIYKKNHMLNKLSQIFKRNLYLSKMSSQAFYQEVQKYEEHKPSKFDYFKNPVGMILADVSNPSMYEYIGRLHALNDLITLYNLKLDILQNKVEISDIHSYAVSKVDEQQKELIQYDAETKALSFKNPIPNTTTSKVYLNRE